MLIRSSVLLQKRRLALLPLLGGFFAAIASTVVAAQPQEISGSAFDRAIERWRAERGVTPDEKISERAVTLACRFPELGGQEYSYLGTENARKRATDGIVTVGGRFDLENLNSGLAAAPIPTSRAIPIPSHIFVFSQPGESLPYSFRVQDVEVLDVVIADGQTVVARRYVTGTCRKIG